MSIEEDLLTPDDLTALEKCESALDWQVCCAAIKQRFGGEYPSDWYAKVVRSGLVDRVHARWGGSTKMTVS